MCRVRDVLSNLFLPKLSFIIVVDRQLHAMDKQAWCNMFNDFNAIEETVDKDEKIIDAEVATLKQMQSAINERLAQLQTAKDKTAKPWNQGISCTIHAELRKAHVANRSLESLVCIACKEFAFCVPKYGDCWPSGGGTINNFRRNLPTKKWTAELDARLNDPNVVAQLQCSLNAL